MSEPLMKAQLYRNPAKGKVFGVCAGIADAFGWDTWIVRVIVLFLAFATAFGLVVTAYLIAFFVLDPKPGNKNFSSGRASRFSDRVDEAKQTFKKEYRSTSTVTFNEVHEKLQSLKTRVESLEAHVTSEKFILEKEFQRMQKNS